MYNLRSHHAKPCALAAEHRHTHSNGAWLASPHAASSPDLSLHRGEGAAVGLLLASPQKQVMQPGISWNTLPWELPLRIFTSRSLTVLLCNFTDYSTIEMMGTAALLLTKSAFTHQNLVHCLKTQRKQKGTWFWLFFTLKGVGGKSPFSSSVEICRT